MVRELRKARQDVESIFCWIRKRSASGAVAWLDAYDALLDRLKEDAASSAMAPEAADFDFEVRQALFKTRRGRVIGLCSL